MDAIGEELIKRRYPVCQQEAAASQGFPETHIGVIPGRYVEDDFRLVEPLCRLMESLIPPMEARKLFEQSIKMENTVLVV